MKTTQPLQPEAPALGPELSRLIERAVLSRAELAEPDLAAWRALSRQVTAAQASVLGQMLGLSAAA